MLSIIIPTLNEENYLPLLLDSIKKQNFNNCEIIVADNNSEDKTVEMAKNFECKVIKGGLPSKGRNEGEKLTKENLLLFIDADVVLPEDFFERTLAEFEKRKLDVASFYLKSKNRRHNFLFNLLYNFPSKITEKILPQAMNIILIKKELHQKIGGFDEEIKIGEELDYIRKGVKIGGKFGILKSTKIFASTRRFQKEGWLKNWLKYFLCQLHMLILSPVKSDIFKYRFDYSKKPKNLV